MNEGSNITGNFFIIVLLLYFNYCTFTTSCVIPIYLVNSKWIY